MQKSSNSRSKILGFKKKAPLVLATGAVLVGLATGAYYLANKPDENSKDTKEDVKTTTESEIDENIETKSGASNEEITTTPAVVAENPADISITDVSIKVLLDFDKTQAYAYLYGPAGKYGVEKLINGSWTEVASGFDYTGRGGYSFYTISSSSAETHYRVFVLDGNTRVETSGDTTITWQQILNNGTLTVPLAE